ncbi:Detected protein of unknown function [Hibiscus syriacus]|uniref:Regulatory E2 n=1 Tax=Hibiscus syriacus TaxID=106335 RepID=A0A6A3A570_HIBSY|nr:Detected protein of unknown function [Hibiscus syriacus]
MPGNEVGDRVHNFLGQEGLSLGQHHSRLLDSAWPGLSNNLWVGGQRQVDVPLVSSLLNFSAHQLAESDRGHSSQSSSQQQDTNFTHTCLRPEDIVDAASRCLYPLDSQIGNGPDLHKKSSQGWNLRNPQQQSGMNDMQLLRQQQHAMLKQMHELQRQQLLKLQFQLPDARQLSSTSQVSSTVKQGMDSLSPAPINGFPLHDASNYSWQPEHMTPNANCLQHGASPAMHISSGGFTFSPEQGQVSLMGLVPPQVDQSFYGISTGGARGIPYHHSSIQMDKPSMQQVPASSSSFPGNQYAVFTDQVGLQDGTLVSRQGVQGKKVFGAAAGQGLNTGFHSENLQEKTIQPKNMMMQESCGRQNFLHQHGLIVGWCGLFWALPSLQSGSWSALMQSAVAETSSNDLGVQDQWGGLGVQNSEPPSGNMPSQSVHDDSKHQLAWVNNKLQTGSSSNSKPFPMSSDANINLDFFSIPGVQQSGVQIANEQNEKMPNDSSQKSVQQLTGKRSKWLDCSFIQKPVSESVQFFGNVDHSPNLQVGAKNPSGHQQGIAVHSMRVQPHNKPNGWNFIDSSPHSGNAISKSQDIDCAFQPSQNSNHRGALHEDKGHGSALDHSIPNANIEQGNFSSSLRSLQVNINREGSDLDNVAAVTDSRTTRVTESSQRLPNNHNIDLRRSTDSKLNSAQSKVQAKYQQNQDRKHQAFDSSENDCLDKGANEANMLEDHSVKETCNDSFNPNTFHHSSTSGMRDNVWMDVNDSRGGKQKSSVCISHKPSGIRKFQYHPMGDLDTEAEPSYGTKSVAHSHAISQHVSQGLKGDHQGYVGQSTFTGHAFRESLETEKGCFPSNQADEVPSKSSNQGSASDRSFVGSVPNKTTPMSQNMLELLPKFDQPRDHDTATHLSSSKCNLSSEMPDTETSDGSVGQTQHNRPSTSEGFGLQLGLPSQRFIIPDRAILSQSSPHVVNSLNSVYDSSGVGSKGHAWLDPKTSVQSPTHGASSGDNRNNVSSVSGQISNKSSPRNIQGNFSTSFTSDYHLKSHLQSQHVTNVGSQATPSTSMDAPFGGLASLVKQTGDSSEGAQTSQLRRKPAPRIPKSAANNNLASSDTSQPGSSDQIHAKNQGLQFPVLESLPSSQPYATSESPKPGAFTKMPDGWTSVSAPQHSLGGKSSWDSQNLFKYHHQSNIYSETTLPGTKKLDNQIAEAEGCGQSELSAGSAKPQSFVGEEQPAKDQQLLAENGASPNPAAMLRDIDALGDSLRPNNMAHQNHSLLHQAPYMKDIEIEPSDRSVKRFKGPSLDSALDTQQVSSEAAEQLSYGPDTMMKDALANRLLAPSNDIVAFSQNGSQHFSSANNSAAILKGGHSQISPQMAPSWFDRYGMFKNEQMSSLYDAQKIAMVKAAEKAFIVGRPSDSSHALHSSEQVIDAADPSQHDSACKNSEPILTEHTSSHSLPPDITNQDLIVVKARKRKSMAFELLPWYREVTQISQGSQNISVGEVEWAHAANRLIEKVEDEPEMIEDWPPVVRSKRRLILTRQLMQQLLHAPPRAFLSADASKNYETVAYFVARSVLGDACSIACTLESDTAVRPDSESILSEKLKERDQSTLKAAEDFIIRAKKLENDLQSLDKRASILDLRLECQDLEKISVINRFARFHGRGQADRTETSSSSDNSHKFFSQRYVIALPMPLNLPDKVQCLSL